jgi:hypothetical protein
MFAAIVSVFLIPNVVLAKKSHHDSSDDGDISSSSSPQSTTTAPGTINDGGFNAGSRAGNAQGRADAISGSDNGFCGDVFKIRTDTVKKDLYNKLSCYILWVYLNNVNQITINHVLHKYR